MCNTRAILVFPKLSYLFGFKFSISISFLFSTDTWNWRKRGNIFTKNANLPSYRIVLYRIVLYRIRTGIHIISYANVCIVLYCRRIVYVKLSRQTIKNRFAVLIGNFAKRNEKKNKQEISICLLGCVCVCVCVFKNIFHFVIFLFVFLSFLKQRWTIQVKLIKRLLSAGFDLR